MQTKISIFFAVELGFSLSLPSAVTHEAYESGCRRAERAIAERRAMFHLGEMAGRHFVPENCKQTAIFSATNDRKRSYVDNISTYLRHTIGFEQGPCRRIVTGGNLEITLEIRQMQTPNFDSNSLSLRCSEQVLTLRQECKGRSHWLTHRCNFSDCHLPT